MGGIKNNNKSEILVLSKEKKVKYVDNLIEGAADFNFLGVALSRTGFLKIAIQNKV